MTETPQADALLTVLISGAPRIEDFAGLTEVHEREKALHVLIAMLSDPDWRLQERAARALGAMKDKRAVEPLLATFEALKVNDKFESDLLNAVFDGLLVLGDAELIWPLLTHGDIGPDHKRRVFAWFDKRDLGRVMTAALRHPNRRRRRITVGLLAYFNDPWSIRMLIAALNDPCVSIRIHSASVLSELRITEAVPFLIQNTTDPVADVRRYTAIALGKMGDKRAVPGLLPLLNDEHLDIRTMAAIALGRLGDSSGLNLMYATIDPGPYTYLEDTFIALKTLRAPVVPLLIKLVEELSTGHLWLAQEMVVLIAEILAEADDPSALPELDKLLSTQDESERTVVRQAIDAINAQKGKQ